LFYDLLRRTKSLGQEGPLEKYRVTLTPEEREGLEQLVSVGRTAARRITHARILLLADARTDGETDESIVEALGCSLRTVARVRQQFVTCGLETAVSRRAQPGRPNKIKIQGDVEQRLVTLARAEPPQGRAHWTLRMLGDEQVTPGLVERVSTETVRQPLKKTTSSRGSSPRGASRPMRTPNSPGEWRT
jgi:uncharacterized membrane protein